MTDFGYYRLYDHGRIASGMYIEVPDVASTIGAAQGRSDTHPTGECRHVETWREQARVRTPGSVGGLSLPLCRGRFCEGSIP
jgi:hypothetical protein